MTIPASVPRNRTGFTSPETHRGYRKNNKNVRIARHVPPNPTAKARFSFAVWTSMPRPFPAAPPNLHGRVERCPLPVHRRGTEGS